MFMRFLRSLMPREEQFVEHFADHTARMVAASDALAAFLAAPAAEREAHFKVVCAIEGEADQIARAAVVGLHRAFITPFERTDIHALINALDDTVDLIEEVAQHAMLYRMGEASPRMHEMARMIQAAARHLAEVMPLLHDITRNAEHINTCCLKIDKIESEADHLLRQAMSDLIAERPETIDFLGRKEVYELLEAVTDRCDDVGNVIEGIVLDHV